MTRDKLSERGFTMVELIVVLAIITLLASAIFVQLQSGRTRARDAEREQEIKTLQNSLALYANNNGKYPPSNQGLLPYASSPLTGDDIVSQDLKSTGTLSSVPTDPMNSGNYIYKYSSSDGSSYEITYYLETDSIPGKKTSNNPQSAKP